MKNLCTLGGMVVAMALLAGAAPAVASDKPAPDNRAVSAPEPDAHSAREAKERYARGMHLFENGDHAGALREFERASDLVPSRLLAYRIAMVYVAMDKPADAVEAIDEVLAAAGSLKPEYLDRAKAAKEELQQKLGELDVKVNVPAALLLDGERVGDAPLQAPLRVAAGEHFLTVVAPGHAPARQAFAVAARGRAELTFELQPSEAKVAHVTVHSPLLGAEVRIDDELVGKTPLAEPVPVLPGKHTVELQRPGYMISHRVVTLGDGVYATAAFDPDEESSGDAPRGQLAIAAGPGPVTVTVNGRPRGTYEGPIDLPAGLHVVKLERKSHEPLARLVDVPAGGEAEVKVTLRPTGKVRTAAAASARSYRNWAIAALVSGALVAGGSTGLALWSNGKLPDARSSVDLARSDASAGGSCDPTQSGYADRRQVCEQTMRDAQSKVDKYSNLRLGGIIGAGAGVALVGVGVAMLLTGPSVPDDDAGDELLAGTLMPAVSATPDGAALWLRGRF